MTRTTKPIAISEEADFAPGDLVVVPFPYSDQFAEKRRPAVVVSNERVSTQGFVWIVMVTSAAHSGVEHDFEIDDLPRAGLSARSIVRPTKIANVEPSRILRRIGRLSDMQSVTLFDTVKSFIGRASRQL